MPQGSQFVLATPDGEAQVKMALVGKHNIANALTAAALVGEVYGLGVHQIANGLRDAGGAPGDCSRCDAGSRLRCWWIMRIRMMRWRTCCRRFGL